MDGGRGRDPGEMEEGPVGLIVMTGELEADLKKVREGGGNEAGDL
jgi:hypothetical protein